MYSFKLTDKFLTNKEQDVFSDYFIFQGLDNGVWEVFSCLFMSGVKNTKPLLLKLYKDSNLYGVAIVIKCNHYGKSLFSNRLLSGLVNLVNIPFYLWIKFGCCMDMMSNPGFVKMTEFAIENGLKSIDLGAVLNLTKQRMLNKSKDMSYFIMSKYSILQKIFNAFLKMTKIQSGKQMKFRYNRMVTTH